METKFVEMYPDYDISHKARCSKCVYHTKLSGGVVCQYILVEGERRPCPAKDCTVYIKGAQRKTREREFFEHNI